MLYSILKDDNPENTVDRIKKIIAGLGIELREVFIEEKDENSPVSLRLSVNKYFHIGTNGKGTCRINALASAYAEFIERLQNSILFPKLNDSYSIIPDKIPVKKNLRFNNEKLKKYFKKRLSVYKNVEQNSTENKKLFLLPFYSVRENKVYNLPYDIIARNKGSNGMAAGNTLEEAFVQGASEVCERYALKQIFTNKIAMPDINPEVYLKYENIKKIIEFFESNGYKICVKDASLGGIVPVVCTIIEDTKNNVFTPSFGGHPSLPIAIERTLTEFTQGIMLSELSAANSVGYHCYSKAKLKYSSLNKIYQSLCLHKIAFERDQKLNSIFYNEKTDFKFSETSWINENKSYSNKELLKYLKQVILNISDDIYIRNVSFLGFPSIDIFVPGMVEILDYTEKDLNSRNLDNLWTSYFYNDDRSGYTLESLFELAETFSFWETLNSKKVFQVPFEYIAFLCALVKKDSKKVIKYIDIVLEQNRLTKYYVEDQVIMLKIIKDYYKLQNVKMSETDIKQRLLKKYTREDVDYVLDILKELTFELILEIVIKEEKVKKFRNKKFFEKLAKKYKNNLPDQKESLEKVFN